jgi:hypothetical protein
MQPALPSDENPTWSTNTRNKPRVILLGSGERPNVPEGANELRPIIQEHCQLVHEDLAFLPDPPLPAADFAVPRWQGDRVASGAERSGHRDGTSIHDAQCASVCRWRTRHDLRLRRPHHQHASRFDRSQFVRRRADPSQHASSFRHRADLSAHDDRAAGRRYCRPCVRDGDPATEPRDFAGRRWPRRRPFATWRSGACGAG